MKTSDKQATAESSWQPLVEVAIARGRRHYSENGEPLVTTLTVLERPAEVRIAEVRPSEARPTEVRPAELRHAEVRIAEVRPAELRPAEVRIAEVRTSAT